MTVNIGTRQSRSDTVTLSSLHPCTHTSPPLQSYPLPTQLLPLLSIVLILPACSYPIPFFIAMSHAPPPSLISISRECCQPFSSLLASVISLFSLFHPVANVFAPVNLASQKIKSNCFKCVFRLPELSQTFLVNILIEQTFMRSGIIYQLFVLC